MCDAGTSNLPQVPIETLVFFDFEATGLFGKVPDLWNEPPRAIPGDRYRNQGQIFREYADRIDQLLERPAPRITEISFVAVRRSIFEEGIKKMHEKCQRNFHANRDEIKTILPTNILTRQVNPELNDQEWKEYEKKHTSSLGAIYLKRSDLEIQPTFRELWPSFHEFLTKLPGPIVMVAHNGLRYDCRVLLAELRRCELLETLPVPSNVYFVDSYLAALDMEKQYQENVTAIAEGINWGLVTEAIFRKRPADQEYQPVTPKKSKLAEDVAIVESLDSEEIICDGTVNPSGIVLERPPEALAQGRSPLRSNQNLANEGWKTAPSRMISDKPSPEELAQGNPLHFMKTNEWSPAKIRRVKLNFFERKDNNEWTFSTASTRNYFTKRGNFRLVTLYTEVIGGSYVEHHAMDDSLALLQVCMAFGKDFLRYMDTHSTLLPPLSAIPLSAKI